MLNPDMSNAEIRQHFGEVSAQGCRDIRAAIAWANSEMLNGDEKHCGCVPFLLTEIARLESLVERERWIPVEERLPEPGSEVLVYRPEQDCGLPEYSGAAEYWGEYGGWYAMDRSRLHGITLWKPINKPEA